MAAIAARAHEWRRWMPLADVSNTEWRTTYLIKLFIAACMPLADVSNTEWRAVATAEALILVSMPLADVSNTEWRW